MKRILSIILLVLMAGIAVIPSASAVSGDDSWSYATIQVAMDENIVCARYDVHVFLDGEMVSTVPQGGLLTFDVLLARGQHRLEFVPDSLLAGAKEWTFSVNRESYTIDCCLQAHILYLQYNRYTISEGNAAISHEEKSRLLDRAEEGVSFIRILASF